MDLVEGGGRGVLVAGNLILTVAHLIGADFKTIGPVTLGDPLIEKIQTAHGKLLRVDVLAVEPVSDVAVLRSLDGQEFYDEDVAFQLKIMMDK